METSPREAVVRKNLAKQLHLLEDGLTLIKVNYPVRHTDGTQGFIDILARDKFGNRVVIELKRSDQAGRQAIHEVFKYLSSYRQQNQIAKNNIRCFIVSTVWRELLVPFSEFVQVSDVQVQGFKLTVSKRGRVQNATPIQPVDPSSVFRVRRSQDAFFFRTERRRNEALPILSRLFDQLGGDSGLLIALDYRGDNANVINPFALYLAVGSINGRKLRSAIRKLGTLETRLCDPTGSMEVRFASSIHVLLFDYRDESEIGFPEKFMSMLQLGWKPQSILRMGAVPDESAATDEELLNAVTGIEGENLVAFERLGTPRLRESWIEIKKKAIVALQCNGHWKDAVMWFLRKIEKVHPEATVWIRIYNPQDLVQTFYRLLVLGTADTLPMFEVGAFVEGALVEAIGGTMLWDQKTLATTVSEMFGGRYRGFKSVLIRSVLHDTRADDELLIGRHGLYYAVFHGQLRNGIMCHSEIQVKKRGGRYENRTVDTEGASIIEFEAQNRSYLIDLMRRYTSTMIRA